MIYLFAAIFLGGFAIGLVVGIASTAHVYESAK